VIRAGRTVAHAEAAVVDDDGREYVRATAVIHLALP
jgi:acyl-coenzyme A thioesterase PaaI-like protein